MKAGIIIEAWKLSIFDRHLQAAGYTYQQSGDASAPTNLLVLTVVTDNPKGLSKIVKAAMLETSVAGETRH